MPTGPHTHDCTNPNHDPTEPCEAPEQTIEGVTTQRLTGPGPDDMQIYLYSSGTFLGAGGIAALIGHLQGLHRALTGH